MRTFKDHVGITIVDYLNRYRILQSLQLLDRHYKHYEIADKVGFQSIKCLAIILKNIYKCRQVIIVSKLNRLAHN